MSPKRLASRVLFTVLLAHPLRAQEAHVHDHAGDTLGRVNFPITCADSVRPAFTHALAFLHSFGYEDARDGFAAVAKADPECGIAHWGVAMTYWHPIWAPPSPSELAAGRAAAEKATALGAKSERERAYIAAIAAFYKDSETLDHKTRANAYRNAMEDVTRRFPEDHEAAIFHALSLLATAPPSDTTFASQKRAAAILNGLLDKEPEHPGIAHYLIHSFDYPELASLALPAARAYSKIAPSSPHALHMPSHIFTRLGLWDESIASNLASADCARRRVAKLHPGTTAIDALHALDYLEYAYLQIGDEPKARAVLEEAARSKTFDDGSFQAGYSLAAIPARWALERRRWKDAAALEAPRFDLPWERFRYATAITPFARAVGAARSGQPDRARAELARLEEVRDALAKTPVPGPYDWASQVEAMRLAAAAWVAFADGKREDALKLARAAAELDEKTGKHPVTPGSVLPPRELLADMLREAGRPADALVEYEASLKEAPNRFNGLYGAARSAALAGRPEKAHAFYAALVKSCGERADREELAEARAFLAREGARQRASFDRGTAPAAPIQSN